MFSSRHHGTGMGRHAVSWLSSADAGLPTRAHGCAGRARLDIGTTAELPTHDEA